MENKTNLTLNQLSQEKTGLVKRYDACSAPALRQEIIAQGF